MRYRYQSGDTIYDVVLERNGDAFRATVYGESYDVELLDEQPGAFVLRAAGPFAGGKLVRPQTVFWAADGSAKWLSSGGCTYRLERPADRRQAKASSAAAGDAIRSPMPAQVRAVQVNEGDEIESGQALLLLEAMKMEIKIAAPRAGRVARLLAKQGDTVERDQVLVELA
jgi:3-methylcrotonyl-CoA carboxylase alpha subunit